MAMNGDLGAAFKVAALAVASTTYARLASSSIKPGKLRLLAILPVVILFNHLPFCFDSINLRLAVSFSLSWLSAFKLLLLALGDRGPLTPSLPLTAFVAVSCLPIKLTDRPSSPRSLRLLLLSGATLVLISLLGSIYQHCPRLLPVVNCLYRYLVLELIIGCSNLLAGSLIGLSLEPYFNAPYLSASLQDFWGRRWNLMVTSILRPSVYHPVKSRLGTSAAFMAVFLVSGIMHEVIYYHVTFRPPTGEVTLFFIVQGLCTALEVIAKKAGWWRLAQHRAAAVFLTMVFMAWTGHLLFFPQLQRVGWAGTGLGEFKAVMRWAISNRGHLLAARPQAPAMGLGIVLQHDSNLLWPLGNIQQAVLGNSLM